MEQICINDLYFTYPLCENEALAGVSFTIRAGEYVVLCGESGCGKTTLLRQMKTALLPEGKRSGDVLFEGKDVRSLSLREQTQIGFVQQDPESAVVTDKVFHELAFGLENLGLSEDVMRLRVAETASFFGMADCFTQKTDTLSGGQLQLLNLASALVMQPKVLILDEPTSQLDPVAASDFLAAVDRIHKELGMTVILTEHRLEEVFPAADRVVVLQDGKITADSTPKAMGEALQKMPEFVRQSMPTAMRIFAGLAGTSACPVTVCEGKQWLTDVLKNKKISVQKTEKKEKAFSGEPALKMRDVFFRYDKNSRDILRGLSMQVPQGCLFALLGGNGTGKSTALQNASGLLRPYRGKIEVFGRDIRRIPDRELYSGTVGVLPQNVCTLFTEKTVGEELAAVDKNGAQSMAKRLRLTEILGKHPYDISGGEQQRTALGKVLLKAPKLLFLDEPTKGMDCKFKAEFAEILRGLCAEGVTVFMVSHDVEFCAKYANRCAMLFDGALAACAPTVQFFANNTFYTTAANRIARHVFPDAITDEDVISLCKQNGC
ncbi:MAG: ABC transporter ATP-binding protein [Acutalibacteraceae bacterium]